jgi:uncharacterized oligopeptide transporter (OPT) family protein
VLGLVVVICARSLNYELGKIEAAAFVEVAVALGFYLVCDTAIPVLVGVAVLAFMQFAHSRKSRTKKLN